MGMRILHLGFEDHRRPGSGGGSLRNHEINRRLAARGHEVHVLCAPHPTLAARVEDGVSYMHVGVSAANAASLLTYQAALPWATRGAIRRLRPDLVVEEFAPLCSSMGVGHWTRLPTVGVVQGFFAREKARQYRLPTPLLTAIERWGTRSHPRLVSMSEALAERLRGVAPASEVAVIGNGVDLGAIRAALDPTPAVEPGLVVFLGRMEIMQKGLDLFVDALGKLSDLPDLRVVLAGDGKDHRAVRARVEAAGVAERVEFAGRVGGADKWRLLARAQVLAMPSRYETFGLSALEAMACGTAVAGFDIPALRETVGAAGMLVPRYDVSALADALRTLVSMRRAPNHSDAWAPPVPLRAAGTDSPIGRRRSMRLPAPDTPRARLTFVALGAFALALVARAVGAMTAFELHIDEVTYAELARTFGQAGKLKLYDQPFNLHPPAFFLLLGSFTRVAGLGSAAPFGVDDVLALRAVPVALGALTCALVATYAARSAGLAAALFAGVIYALDPFVVRFDSRVFLETPTLLFVVVGALLLLRAPRSRVAAVGGGLAFGLALVTKDMAVFVTLVPLALCWLLGPEMRRAYATAAGVAISVYALQVLVILVLGGGTEWIDEKLSGVLRIVGARQETGFNSEGTVSLVETLRRNGLLYGASYLMIAVGTVAAVLTVLERRKRAVADGAVLLAAIQLSAAGQLAYGILLGTLEEQMFYFIAVPSALTIAIVAGRRWSGCVWTRAAVIALAAVWLTLAATSWVSLRTDRDDGYQQLAAWAQHELPAGTRIGVSDEIGQFVMPTLVPVPASGPRDLARTDTRYVLVSTRLAEDGFGLARPAFVDWLQLHARLAYAMPSRTMGELRVYEVTRAESVS